MRRAAAIVLAVAVALAAGGCAKLTNRTDPQTLDGAVSHAFKRYYAAAYRMTTGHPRGGIIVYAKVRCRALEAEPKGDRGWSWLCRITWQRRDRRVRHPSTYRVSVDRQGCFAARSADFPATLSERVLDHRPARNPLVYIRSCP
jgi:hypothetical protein